MSKFPVHRFTEIIYKPKWKREAIMLQKAGSRFLNYKRDLLDDDAIAEIDGRVKDLKEAISANDKAASIEAGNRLESACQDSLPRSHRKDAISENVEVIFVAIVIALGIRAYILQPFRIPTGSMQPSLNGITGEVIAREDWPSFPVRMAEIATKGRTYIHEEVKTAKRLAHSDAAKSITQSVRFNFFTYTTLHFDDNTTLSINAPRDLLLESKEKGGFGLRQMFGLASDGRTERITRPDIPAGTVIASGYSQSGDLVLVDKVSYHFRTPERGETFVFDTRGLKEVHKNRGAQGGGSHYIKRLAGLPGDTLSIGGPQGNDGKLYIDGKVAGGKGFERVMNRDGDYAQNPGYALASPPRPGFPLDTAGDRFSLKKAPKAKRLMEEYAALGDNTDSSFDSRYWGPVKEYNLIGPALFSLWPFATGHWGFIE